MFVRNQLVVDERAQIGGQLQGAAVDLLQAERLGGCRDLVDFFAKQARAW
ncbi:MAG: hypothetical protein IPQ17_05640 [Xanthomonadales bacterium]|nr:hypothetical protein [Xanthomonadales bacterium]